MIYLQFHLCDFYQSKNGLQFHLIEAIVHFKDFDIILTS